MTALHLVLSIGIAGHHNLTPEQMGKASQQMTQEAIKADIAFEAIFIHSELSQDERSELQKKLQSKSWAIVQIGSGLRLVTENTRLLEDVVNMVLSTVHPTPKLAFPTQPNEMIPTFQRLLAL
jgi:vacuolar-type H+-ATPase subunit F/Vma7